MIDQFYSAHVVVFHKDSILLVKHGKKADHITGVLGLPGGRLKEKESEKTAAVREVFEEAGIKIKESNLYEFPNNVYSAYIKRKTGSSGVFTMKVFMTATFTQTLKKSDETEPVWIKIPELNTLALLPNVKQAIMAAKHYYDSVKKTLKIRTDYT